MDAGFMQKDLAKRWGVDEAQVSRFIRIGEPELDKPKAQILAGMLSMTVDELFLRLDQDLAPRRGARPASVVPRHEPEVRGAPMDELRRAIERAKREIPGIRVTITFGENGA